MTNNEQVVLFNKSQRRDIFRAYIASFLADDPGALQFALSGITDGMNFALEKQRELTIQKDRAMLAAFSLLNPERLTTGVKEMLGSIIVECCSKNGSNVENDMKAKYGNES